MSSIKEVEISCAVCGNRDLAVYEIGGLRRASCSLCHHSQRVDIEHFEYKAFAMGGTATSEERLQSQAGFIIPHLRSGITAIEIGCAAGDLARVLRSRHQFLRYDGIELSPAAKVAASVMNTVFESPSTKLLHDKRVKQGEYDLILSSHCLEHLLEPGVEIANMKSLMAGDGLLFIEVPNRSGSAFLPYDDNRSHLHFFSLASLSRLLSINGFEITAAGTGAWHDARYPDSIRIIARAYQLPPLNQKTLLSNRLDTDKVVVWGVGKMCQEMLEHFFDPARIAYFVDSDIKKQGTLCLNRPVRAPEALIEEINPVVLINSLEFEEPIRRQIESQFSNTGVRIIAIRELLTARGASGGSLLDEVPARQ